MERFLQDLPIESLKLLDFFLRESHPIRWGILHFLNVNDDNWEDKEYSSLVHHARMGHLEMLDKMFIGKNGQSIIAFHYSDRFRHYHASVEFFRKYKGMFPSYRLINDEIPCPLIFQYGTNKSARSGDEDISLCDFLSDRFQEILELKLILRQ